MTGRLARCLRALRILCCSMLGTLLVGCDERPWNDPWPAAHRGRNVLYESFGERPKHLDPATSYSEDEAVFIGQIYEPPLQYHYLRRPYALEPLAATAVPVPEYRDAAGNLLPVDAPAAQVASATYRITLRDDLRYAPHPAFHTDRDGRHPHHALAPEVVASLTSPWSLEGRGSRAVTAADYAHQVKRLVDPRRNSPIAGLMAAHVKGLAELGEQLSRAPLSARELHDLPVAGLRVIDERTLEIVLRDKYPQFVYWLAMSFFAPMPWEADAFHDQPGLAERNVTLDWWPVGSGPYVLTENNPNRRMVLERNPLHRPEPYPAEGMPGDAAAGRLDDAGRPMPFIDVAWYSLEKEAIPVWNKFLQGYYDRGGVQAEGFDQVITFGAGGEAQLTEVMRARGLSLVTAVEPSIYYTGFNMQDPVVGGLDARGRALRQALSIALDVEEFVGIFRNGRGEPAHGPLPPGLFGVLPGEAGMNAVVYRWQEGRAVRRPLAEAQALLAAAGYPAGRDPATGRALVLHLDSAAAGPGSKAVLDWHVKQFARLGIELVIRATDYSRFRDKVNDGSAQIFQWGWNADYPDPENFFFLLYGPNAKVVSGGENAANYASPEFDALFGEMKDLPDGAARQAVIERMLGIVREDAPWIFGFHPVAFSLHHAWYHNAVPNLLAKNTLKYKRIDPLLREEHRRAWNRPRTAVLWLMLGFLAAGAVAVVALAVARGRRRLA